MQRFQSKSKTRSYKGWGCVFKIPITWLWSQFIKL